MGCSSSTPLNNIQAPEPEVVKKIVIPQPTAGYLQKQGQSFPKSWQKRFFVLKEGTLVYYKRETFVHSNVGEDKLDALLLKNFTVEDLEKTFEVLSKNGVHFNAPPQHSPDGYAKVTFCRGPENLFLELVEVIKI